MRFRRSLNEERRVYVVLLGENIGKQLAWSIHAHTIKFSTVLLFFPLPCTPQNHNTPTAESQFDTHPIRKFYFINVNINSLDNHFLPVCTTLHLHTHTHMHIAPFPY